MNKDNAPLEDTYLNLKRKENVEEVLEISSTGYGLESVTEEKNQDFTNDNQ